MSLTSLTDYGYKAYAISPVFPPKLLDCAPPQRPDHSPVVPTKDTHSEGCTYKKETHDEGYRRIDTLVLKKIEMIKRWGYKSTDTRIVPYNQDEAQNFSTPSEIMEIFIKSFKSKDEKYLNLIEQLKSKGIPEEIAEEELRKFYNYWTELNQAGIRQKWEMEKCFELRKRLTSWFNNYQKFRPKQQEKKGMVIT